MPSSATRPLLLIHLCVFLWGFTAIFGRLISLPASQLVWWRMLIVSALLLALPRVRRELRRLPPRLAAACAGIGVLVALHWVTFYASIKLANASVGATTIALAPVFLALIEPLLARSRFDFRDLAIGILVVPGVVLVVGGIPHGMRAGFAVGIVSAVFVAVFGALNKRIVNRAGATTMTCVELGAGAVFLTLVLPWLPHSGPAFVLPGPRDAWLLALLAIGCTLLPFTLALVALRQLSAFTAQLAVNLEPVYAIVLAAVLLGEQRRLDAEFYLGVAIIIAAVFAHPLLMRRRQRTPQAEMLGTAESKIID